MTLKTNKFVYDLIKSYKELNLDNSSLWVCGCTISNSGSEEISQAGLKESLDNIIFGSEIQESDFIYMIKQSFWQQNLVYSMYDDKKDMQQLSYFTIVEPAAPSEPYAIFKCIYNNENGPSTIKPVSLDSINLVNGIYRLADGYIWKYLGKIESSVVNKFLFADYFPVSRDLQVESIANSGINFIKIENLAENKGYSKFNCTISSVITQNSRFQIQFQTPLLSSNSINYFKDMSVRYSPNVNTSYVYRISASTYVDSLTSTITLENINPLVSNSVPIVGNLLEIIPSVDIVGNGTGAVAYPIVSNTGSITSIQILNSGINYTSATAEIVATPSFNDQNPNSTTCILRPIISPENGHGANILSELNINAIGITTSISSVTPSNIPSTGDYSRIILLKNPVFTEEQVDDTFDNRIVFELGETLPPTILIGDVVTQAFSNVVISGIIHEIQGNNLYISNYNGNHTQEFNSSLPIIIRNQSFSINSITRSNYVQNTGDVLYSTSFTPVQRTIAGSEKIKFIIDF